MEIRIGSFDEVLVLHNEITELSFPKKGIAKKLLLEQERRVSEMGAKEILVKSMNKYKAMLLLLITQNYAITGVQRSAKGDDKIHFTKKFNQ